MNEAIEGPIEAAAASATRTRDMDDLEKLAERISVQVRAGMLTAQPEMIVIDMTSLARAESKFIKSQTRFLRQPNDYGTQEYLNELSAYSRAQADLIDSLQLALHQAGIV